MEDQDKLIITSLKRMKFNLPGTVAELKDIDSDILQSICSQFLEKLGYKQKDIGTSQKFRIINQIQEDLKKEGGIRIEISVLMNPQQQDLRKLLISIVSRLSLSDNNVDESQQKIESHQEKVQKSKLFVKEKIQKYWKSEQWIHPLLLQNEAHSKPFRIYETNVDLHSNSLQKALIINNFDKEIKPNFFTSLARVIDHEKYLKYEQERLKGKFYVQGANQKNLNAQKHANQLKDMSNKNANEWKNLKNNRITQITQQIQKEEIKQQQQQLKEQNKEQEKQSLFELEQTFAAEEKQNAINQENDEFNLEELKKKHEEEMEEVQKTVDQLMQKMQKLDKKRQQFNDSIKTKQEQVENYKEANKQLQSDVEQLHLLLEQLKSQSTGKNNLAKEVQQLENDIQSIEEEWDRIKTTIEQNIQQQREIVIEKKQKIDQLVEKSKRYESEYVNIIGEIRNAYDKKEKLNEEVQRLPKDYYGRHTYVRSITEIGKNFNKQKDDIKKIIQDVEEQDEQISGLSTTLQRYYIEFENSFHTDPKKKESLHVQIFKLYEEYKQIFEKTINTLKDSSGQKIEIREQEAQIEIILSKGYKNSLAKLQRDLQDVKTENQQFQQQLEYYKSQSGQR